MPLLEGPPLMDPLDVTHGVLRKLEFGAGLSAGATITLQALGLLVSVEFSAVRPVVGSEHVVLQPNG